MSSMEISVDIPESVFKDVNVFEILVILITLVLCMRLPIQLSGHRSYQKKKSKSEKLKITFRLSHKISIQIKT